MEVLSSILGALVAETSKLLCGSINSRIKYSLNFKGNLENLEKMKKNLVDLNNDIKNQLESALKDGRSSPTTEVKRWLREVDEFVTNVESLQASAAAAAGDNSRLCGGLCGHCSLRSRISKQMEAMLKMAESLLEAGSFQNGLVCENHSVQPVEYIPGAPLIEYQTSASTTLAQLMEKLDDDAIGRIGVWGMGGVGKTALIKNLNNKLISASTCSSSQPFSIVIWVTVSKELDEKRIQQEIATRLSLKVNLDDSVEKIAILLHQRLQRERKFLLILDDLWEKIDLDRLGVPPQETHEGSKIILTSRSSEVCGDMMVDFELKVNILSEEEAWQLFSRKAGEKVHQKQIQPYAKAVMRECGGLPLAIITVGTAMRGKTVIERWEHALTQLQRSMPRIRGVEDKVFNPLKWSYDSLKDENTKACFLYCALFPEDFSIEISELVQCWTAEGLIDEQPNHEDSTYINGIVMVETLKDSCLLEDGARKGTVKMHDVVRDVSIWIASSLKGECKHKSLVRSGINLSEISKLDFSNSLKRASFMNNKISELPDCEIQGSEVSTLLLQGNHQLERVPERFLQSFPSLRVLNISRTSIQSLPASLIHLSDLRALLLGNCTLREMLPSIGMLIQLQVLDLSATRIIELPKEMGNLIYLRQVNLSRNRHLKAIAAGVVSKWACLEVLEMAHSSYIWSARGDVEEGQAFFEELGSLKQLVSLSINLKSIPSMASVLLSSMCRLRKFQFYIGDGAVRLNKHDEQMVTISQLSLSMERVRWFLANAGCMIFNKCFLDKMFQELAVSSVRYGKRNITGRFEGLKLLTIAGSKFESKRNGGCISPCDLLPNLEELHLHSLTSLESISELFGCLGLSFSKLKLIEVSSCPDMKYLLHYGSSILDLPNLETVQVGFCNILEQLFKYTSGERSSEDPIPTVVPKLRILELKNLDNLAILGQEETWPCLEQVFVVHCSRLKRLPLNIRSVHSIKEIKGEPTWWGQLQWDDRKTMSALQPYYKPIGFWRQDTGRY